MDWDAIGAVGEILGAVAVVISILYLAKQINANTRSMKANAGFEATHSWAEFNQEIAWISESNFTTVLDSYGPSATWNETPQVIRARLSVSHRALFQKLEGQYYLYKYGALDEGLWTARTAWAAGSIKNSFYKTWWEIEKQSEIYSREFVSAIDSAASINVSLDSMYGNKNNE